VNECKPLMLGDQGSAANKGIIPRAVAKIVEAAQAGHLFKTTLHRHRIFKNPDRAGYEGEGN